MNNNDLHQRFVLLRNIDLQNLVVFHVPVSVENNHPRPNLQSQMSMFPISELRFGISLTRGKNALPARKIKRLKTENHIFYCNKEPKE